MAQSPAHVASADRLPDGRRVIIRPVRPDDAGAMRAFLDRLSDGTKRLRFMKLAHQIDADLVRHFTQIDQDSHVAFVCEADGTLVGDARYVANPDGASGELGIVVADDWRHSGAAQLLMEALLRAARARGLRRMQGIVLAGNRDMLDFTREFGFEASAGPEGTGTVRIEKSL